MFNSLPIVAIRQGMAVFVLAFLMSVLIFTQQEKIGLDIILLFFVLNFGFLVLALFRQVKMFLLIGLFFLGGVVGLTRVSFALVEENKSLAEVVMEEVILTGEIKEDPDERDNSVRVVIKNEVQEKILVVLPLGTEVSYGDVVEVKGQLTKPKNFVTETGREFGYVNYLKAKNIYFILNRAELISLSPAKNLSLHRSLFFIKNKFVSSLENYLPEPHASLATGLVVGARRGLGEDWSKLFRQAGLIHIVVLSGYNITIIAQSFLRATNFFLSRRISLVIAGLSIFLFSILVGGGPTVVRAAIMAIIVLVAQATGRFYAVGTALAIACFVMVFHNPLILVFDAGFQLSFLATIGLICGSTLITHYFRFIPETFGLREIVGSTIATQIFVLPWLIYIIGEFSVVAVVVNILVLPLIPVTMFLVAVVGFVGVVFSQGLFVSFPAYIFLAYILKIVQVATSFSWSSILIPPISFGVVVILYLLIFSVWFKLSYRLIH